MIKNKKTMVQIKEIWAKIFGEDQIETVIEIEEGMFNAIYSIKLIDGKTYFLKIAPSKQITVMRQEHGAMQTEVKALQLLKNRNFIFAPTVRSYSTDKDGTEFFIMNKLPGCSMAMVKDELDEQQLSKISYECGQLNYRLNRISNDYFGSLIEEKYRNKEWFPVFRKMLEDMLDDARDMDIDIAVSAQEMMCCLKRDEHIFYEVREPSLVHWDLWEHNIIINSGKIVGFVDFERAFWGDYLMEFGFRSYQQSEPFLQGYGKTLFSKNERRRILWYDVYWFLFNINEGFYRNYEDNSLYHWGIEKLQNVMKQIYGG